MASVKAARHLLAIGGGREPHLLAKRGARRLISVNPEAAATWVMFRSVSSSRRQARSRWRRRISAAGDRPSADAKAALKRSAGDWDNAQEVFNVERVRGSGDQQVQGLADDGVAAAQIGRAAGHNAGGLNHHRRIRLFPAHEAVQHSCGFIALLLSGHGYAGKLHRRQFAKHFVVIHAQHGHLLGDAKAVVVASVHDMAAIDVTAGKDAHGFG